MSRNIGIASLGIVIISLFLPYIAIGSIENNFLYFATETENTDWIGVLIFAIGSALLITEQDRKIALVLTIIGGLFPLYRFYKIVTADVGFAAFAPSFGIGGYLILLAVAVQLYGCLSQEESVS
jgi:hypothetical protein